MRLKREQCEKLLSELGIWVTEACDKCGQLLGSIRWTRQGECWEWCSKSCRDGIAAGAPKSTSKGCLECGLRLDGMRSDSRFCSDTHKKRYRLSRASLVSVMCPIQGGSSPVPSDDRGGLHHLQTSAPTRPESRQQNP
jgi:hypothetical protein